MRHKANRINDKALEGLSPEKAGVGGSIPSLATTNQLLTNAPFRIFIPIHSNSHKGIWCGSQRKGPRACPAPEGLPVGAFSHTRLLHLLTASE